MTYLTPNHPAVEAATPDIHSISLREYTPEDCHETIADALNAALPHLTADDLRDTPAGQALIAEGRGWTPTTERDRRALAILNDPTVPATTRHTLANAMRFLHKLERMTGR